jgi:hypothetical protein
MKGAENVNLVRQLSVEYRKNQQICQLTSGYIPTGYNKKGPPVDQAAPQKHNDMALTAAGILLIGHGHRAVNQVSQLGKRRIGKQRPDEN